jgi:succinate dehydrogenase / fumarate reductase cytochrome b subunit
LVLLLPWVVVHLASMLPVVRGGPVAWDASRDGGHGPLRALVVAGLVVVPMVLHGAWGAWGALWRRPNLGRFPFAANVLTVLQPLTAAALAVFLVPHLVLVMTPWVRAGRGPDAAYLQAALQPLLAWDFYVMGVAAAALHGGAGTWRMAARWGWVTTPRSRRWLAAACGAGALLLAGVGVLVVSAFHHPKYILLPLP